ncbi:DUF599 domain-containing protein [Falsihalocynthiibacter sp. SS001]|uniref:DUF599 domain-containing protein n=1 Tax=Falsihalocynthiibacter sp. SS001 TaxID=3349698 RepID=UPI0036D41442
MELLARLAYFEVLDGIAVAVMLLSWIAIGWKIENPSPNNPSVSIIMADYRREWMLQYITRQPRIFDATILSTLRMGTTFFASACMIGIGGGLALIGNQEKLLGLAEDLTLDREPAVVWEVKILLVLLILASGFLKFVWSHRLFGYAAVVMAAAPNDADDPMALKRAKQSGEINITAARSYNRGLRSIYFALAALAWMLGAIPLIIATFMTSVVLWRREFASHSRMILLEGWKS